MPKLDASDLRADNCVVLPKEKRLLQAKGLQQPCFLYGGKGTLYLKSPVERWDDGNGSVSTVGLPESTAFSLR